MLVTALAGATLCFGIVHHTWPWIIDDAFISMRYAERLLDGQGLTWTDGERVEGYSNLLWVMLTALLGAFGFDLVTAVRLLGIACTTGTFAVLAFGGVLPPRLPAQLAVVAVAACGMTAAWTIGGLETPLLSLLVAIAMVGMHAGFGGERGERGTTRAFAVAGVALALACWTRPDAPIWVVAAGGVAVLYGGRRRWVATAWLVGAPLVAVSAQTAFRWLYYGDWLPNTARAKLPVSAPWKAGCEYVGDGLLAMLPLLCLAAFGLVGLYRRRDRALSVFALASFALWLAYFVRVGGDVFPFHRFFVPLLVPTAVLAGRGLDAVAVRGSVGKLLAWAGASLAIATTWAAAGRATATPGALSHWEWDALATGEWLGRAFGPIQPLLAVDAAGGVPFASRLPCLDMLGLCDRAIAATPFDEQSGFVIGHARGNGGYVLARRPDLVMFHIPPGAPQPNWLSGIEMERSPEFLREYRAILCDTGPVRLGDGEAKDLRLVMRVRTHGRAGMRREGTAWVVPGWLLGSFRQAISYTSPPPERAGELQDEFLRGVDWLTTAAVVGVLDETGTLVGEIRAPGRHVVSDLALPPGPHRVEVPGLPDGVRCALEASASGQTDLVCEVSAAAHLPVRIERVLVVDG